MAKKNPTPKKKQQESVLQGFVKKKDEEKKAKELKKLSHPKYFEKVKSGVWQKYDPTPWDGSSKPPKKR